MTEHEFELETIRVQLSYLVDAVKKNPALSGADPIPEFVTLELAAKLKGGAAYNTYKSRYHFQPCGGTRTVRVGGKKCWRREDVLEWLSVDDTALESYLQKFGVAIKKY